MKKFGNALWGLVFIALGLILGLNAFGITNINIFFKGWWTMFIIIPCFIGLFKNTNKTGDVIGLLIGIMLLLGAQGILSYSTMMKLILPLIFIMVGLSLIFHDAINSKINSRIKELNKEGLEEYTATFSEQKVNMQNIELKGASLNAIFGSVEFNLRGAKIEGDKVINASAIFGGIDILVPQNVIVKVKSTPIFGGVSNDTVQVSKQEGMPTLYINAFCMFGGVEIK